MLVLGVFFVFAFFPPHQSILEHGNVELNPAPFTSDKKSASPALTYSNVYLLITVIAHVDAR